jgi:hypothetical protein
LEPDDFDETETDYQMSAHITDLDDLLGRDKRPVLWPPPQSPEPEMEDRGRPEVAFSPSPPPPPVMSPSPIPPPLPPQVNLKKQKHFFFSCS